MYGQKWHFLSCKHLQSFRGAYLQHVLHPLTIPSQSKHIVWVFPFKDPFRHFFFLLDLILQYHKIHFGYRWKFYHFVLLPFPSISSAALTVRILLLLCCKLTIFSTSAKNNSNHTLIACFRIYIHIFTYSSEYTYLKGK